VDDKVNYALVGIFVLGLGAALVVAVLWLAAGIDTQKKYEPYQSVIKESVAGLSIAAPVKYMGVDVGKVSEIAIDPQNSRQVRVKFLIERGTPIKQDTEAVMKSQGLTGIAYIELSGGSVGAPGVDQAWVAGALLAWARSHSRSHIATDSATGSHASQATIPSSTALRGRMYRPATARASRLAAPAGSIRVTAAWVARLICGTVRRLGRARIASATRPAAGAGRRLISCITCWAARR